MYYVEIEYDLDETPQLDRRLVEADNMARAIQVVCYSHVRGLQLKGKEEPKDGFKVWAAPYDPSWHDELLEL